MRKIVYILCLYFVLSFQACSPSQPSSYRGMPQKYTTAYEEIYGHFYDSIPYAVVALDLYSEGLTLNEQHRMTGTGYNLYLSDIFVPDSLLVSGVYHSDTTASPFTFLPGRDYEGTPHGMYLLYVEEGRLQSIQLLDSGYFSYMEDTLAFTLYYRNAYGEKAIYEPRFAGMLIPFIR